MTREEITNLVTTLGDTIQVLKDADPADKAEVYSRLGVALTYHPEDKRVQAEARPNSIMYVRACPRRDLDPGIENIRRSLEPRRAARVVLVPAVGEGVQDIGVDEDHSM